MRSDFKSPDNVASMCGERLRRTDNVTLSLDVTTRSQDSGAFIHTTAGLIFLDEYDNYSIHGSNLPHLMNIGGVVTSPPKYPWIQAS
jgi:hypothetical protein